MLISFSFSTDFYHTKRDESDKIGFPKGMRDQILYGAMQRYDPDCLLQTMTADGGALGDDGETAPPAVEEVILESEDLSQKEHNSSKKNLPSQKSNEKTTFLTSDYKNGAVFETHCKLCTTNTVLVKSKNNMILSDLNGNFLKYFKSFKIRTLSLQSTLLYVRQL